VRKGERAPKPVDLSRLEGAQLAAALSSPDKPVREIARRLIIERADTAAIEAVRTALREQSAPSAAPSSATAMPVAIALEHLWTLHGAASLDRAIIQSAFASESPTVRVHALRMAETMLPANELASALVRAVDDADRAVRVQSALSAGTLAAPLRVAVLEPALRRDLAARDMRSAAMSSVAGAEPQLLDAIMSGALLADDSVPARAFAAELTDLLLDNGSGRPDAATLRHTLASIAAVASDRPWLARAMLERIAARQRLNAKEPVQLVAGSEPTGWFAMLDANHRDLELASAVDRQLFWPGREDVSFVPPKLAKSAAMSVEEFGKRLYSNCMSCHQANGRGLPPVYPPLRNSEIVHGDPEVLVKILLHGLEGRIEVDGQTYNQVMPAAPIRGDDEIAAVLSYVRSAWGNTGSAIDPALVAKVRDETKGRTRAFTARELGIEAK
jgi:mono/diheme cytochrome c family protein